MENHSRITLNIWTFFLSLSFFTSTVLLCASDIQIKVNISKEFSCQPCCFLFNSWWAVYCNYMIICTCSKCWVNHWLSVEPRMDNRASESIDDWFQMQLISIIRIYLLALHYFDRYDTFQRFCGWIFLWRHGIMSCNVCHISVVSLFQIIIIFNLYDEIFHWLLLKGVLLRMM